MENKYARVLGGQIPKGSVRVSGAKNAATKILAASLISDEEVLIENFPTEIVDANYKFNFIRDSGGDVVVSKPKSTVLVNANNYTDTTLDNYNYQFRTTYLLVPGLIKRSGRARIPYPGGCKIGNRGYDIHTMIWEKFGGKVIEHDDYIEVVAEKGFTACTIDFPISTIGGTENALISASIIDGTSYIKNAYISPEVSCLINFLKTLGVRIEVVGNSFISVTGKEYLKGSIFEIMPDRIEALTWLVYGVLSKGDITIEDVPFQAMEVPLIHVKDAGVDFYSNTKNIHITPACLTNGVVQPFELATGTHPGIISDMQPFFVLLGLHADGNSRVFDYRYPERLQYCQELQKFYPGQLEWKTGEIRTLGRKDPNPQASICTSTDLRGSMALVIAALLSEGESCIHNVEMALRGYNDLEHKLKGLGVNIEILE